jgi:hypothetical protein
MAEWHPKPSTQIVRIQTWAIPCYMVMDLSLTS